MDYVELNNRSFSKIICGSNPFYGKSHFSESRSAEYLNRFTDEEITRVVEACLAKGVNTVETSANERIFRIASEITASEPNKRLHLISTTRIDETSAVRNHEEKLGISIKQRCSICVIHSQYIENELRGGRINGIESLLEKIHNNGLLTGISTHRNDVIELCERQGYEIDVYLFPLNNQGFVYPGYTGKETTQDRISIIKRIMKPFIIIKTMAAGRIPPGEALSFIHDNIKSNDLVSIGFGSVEEVDETLGIWEKLG